MLTQLNLPSYLKDPVISLSSLLIILFQLAYLFETLKF